jgi:hypothetical protein
MKTPLLILCTLLALAAFCQSPKTLTVISTNGLKLREQPNIQSKVIKILPYGAMVELLGMKYSIPDSLGIFQERTYEIIKNGQPKKMSSKSPLIGYWLKARHQQSVGYLFDAFLADTTGNAPAGEGFAIVIEGYTCEPNFHYNPAWHWYGLYEVKGRMDIKPVELRIMNNPSSNLMSPLHFTTNLNEESLFVIGCKQALPIGETSGKPFHRLCSLEYVEAPCTETELKQAGLEYIPSKTIGDEWHPGILTAISKTGNRQKLEPPKHIHYQGETTPYYVPWHGDLDGDGETDYLVVFGLKPGFTVLFLSSKAKKGQLVKAVAFWKNGWCC